MKTILAVLVAIGFFWAFYTAAMAVRSYWQLSEVVDGAVDRGGRAGPGAVRDVIIKGAAEAEVPIAASDVVVSEDQPRMLSIRLRWSWPVIVWRGEQIIQIPLSIERTALRPS